MQQIDCPCRISYNVKDLIMCSICHKYQHRQCLKGSLTLNNFECPSCQIKCSDPFIKSLLSVLEPSLLLYSHTTSLFKSIFVISRDIPRTIEKDYSLSINKKFIIFRCLRIDNVGFEHHWPMNCSILINGKLLKYFSDPKELHRSAPRKDYPFVFYFQEGDFQCNYHGFNKIFMLKDTDYLLYDQLNTIEIRNDIHKNPKDVFSYVVSIELVEVIKDVEEAIRRIPIINDLSTLKNALMPKGQSELEVLNEKVSFVDCYTVDQKRIKIPARSINCQHMTVFDLRNYLLIRRNKIYNCPFCKAKAVRVYVDGFIKYILEDQPDAMGIVITNEYNIVDYEVNPTSKKEEEKEKEKDKMKSAEQAFEKMYNKKQDEIIDIENEECQEIGNQNHKNSQERNSNMKIERNPEETDINNPLVGISDVQMVNLCDDSDNSSECKEKEKKGSKKNIFLVRKNQNIEKNQKSIPDNNNRNINIQITNYAPRYNTQSFNNLLNQKKENTGFDNRKVLGSDINSDKKNSLNYDKMLEKTFYPNFTRQMKYFDYFDHLAKNFSK